MREHGQNLPEPDPGSTTFRMPEPPGGQESPQWQAAMEACQLLLPSGLRPQPPGPEELEQLRNFAICMRAHDIEMTDPLPNGNMKIGGRLAFVTRAELQADPGYQAATAACQDKLPHAADVTEVKG
jgi:hypothetical protein